MRVDALAAVLFIVAVIDCSQSTSVAAPPEKPAASSDKPGDAKAVLKQLASFYREKNSCYVDVEQKISMKVGPIRNSMESDTKLTIERPNRFAMRQKNAETAFEVVSDGESLSMSMAMLKQYTQSAAPKSIDDLLANPLIMVGMGGRGPLLDVFTSDPYKTLMEGVTSEEYAGREKIGEAETHHLRFAQDQFDWELWVAVGEQPVVVKAAFDMKKSLAASGLDDEQLKDAQFSIVQSYKNWQFDKELPDDAFKFEPPQGAKKVDDFFAGGAGGGEPEISPLVGKPAPEVDLELLDGGRFTLKEQKGKVVILDFWATWCGPCVREMPLVAKVAEEYREKGVVLCCLDQREDSGTIREFLKDKDLKVSIGLDSEGDAGNAYGVHGIPTLVLVDKAGVVQSVHVGFSPNIGDKLKKELDAVLAGKDLAAEAERARKMEDAALPTEGLKELWSKPGAYTGVAAAADGKSFFAVQNQNADVYSVSGEKTGSIKLAAPGGLLRTARLSGKDPGDLLVFDVWAQELTALDGQGKKLWAAPRGQGIDDVWAADLDTDGKDEVIVGYNGGTGLHIFAGDGKERWKFTSIGNVWHVAAGDLDGDGAVEVVTTSAAGKVHVFDGNGMEMNTLDPGIYANMVRVFRLPGESADAVLVVGGGIGQAQMAAMSGKGDLLWQSDLPDKVTHCDSLAFAPGTTWAALGCRGGLVCVIDVRTGEMIGAASHQGTMPQVAWAPTDDQPLLLAATHGALKAWRVKPKDSGDAK